MAIFSYSRGRRLFLYTVGICLLLIQPGKAQTLGGTVVAVGRPSAPAKTEQPIYLANSLLDRDGRIWGISQGDESNGICYWKDGAWRRLAYGPEKFRPILFTLRPNGAVIVLWQARERVPQTGKNIDYVKYDYEVSEHQGDRSRLIARFTASFKFSPKLYADAKNIWVTLNDNEIYRVAPNLPLRRVFRIPLYTHKEDQYGSYESNPMRCTVDGEGRSWFYSNIWSGREDSVSFHGVIIWDGKRCTHYKIPPGLPNSAKGVVSTISVRDSHHLWLAINNGGLFSIDTRTLRAQPIAVPSPKAFQYVQQITPTRDGVYVVTGSRWGEPKPLDYTIPNAALWRWTPKGRSGQWTLLLDGLDRLHYYDWNPNRPLLHTAEGLWVGGMGTGLWLIPKPSGSKQIRPIQFNWRRGFAETKVYSLFNIGEGKILMASPGLPRILDAKKLLQSASVSPTPSPFRVLNPFSSLMQDRRGRLWAIPSFRSNKLGEWDGVKWRYHPLPKGYDLDNLFFLLFDRLNRVWFSADDRDGQVLIYDPAHDSWKIYPHYRDALLAQVAQNPKNPALPLLYRMSGDYDQYGMFMVPDYYKGRLCYRDGQWRVRYYDGKQWHVWSPRQIRKDTSNDTVTYPFFGRQGTLLVRMDDMTLYWSASKAEWMDGTDEEDARPGAKDIHPLQKPVPSNTLFSAPEFVKEHGLFNATYDERGAAWLVWKNQLYKLRPGMSAPQSVPGQNQPFLDRRSVVQVLVDNRNNVFLKTENEFHEYVILPPAATVDTKVSLAKNAVDSFTFTFSSPTPRAKDAPLWFRWRMDGKDWAPAQLESTLRLDDLLGGRHVLEVTASGPSIESDPTPARIEFTVDINPDEQVSSLIAQLSSPDYAQREAAIPRLAKHGKRALTALKKARPLANENAGWWMDAAIQETERVLNPPPPIAEPEEN